MSKFKVDFKDSKKAFDKIQAKMQEIKTKFVVIGVTEKKGTQPHTGRDASIAEVAFWNEYGTSKIPERPFLRSSVDVNREAIQKTTADIYLQVQADKLSVDAGLTKLGFMMKEFIQRRINTAMEWATPLSPYTVARKKGLRGPNQPLIDSGLLLRSIDFEVKK